VDGPRRFIVAEFHKLIDFAILMEGDKVDLLEGLMIRQEKRSPPHEYSRHAVFDAIAGLLSSDEWTVRNRGGVTLSDSELVPDVAIVRADKSWYTTRHPRAADFGIVIEVADVTLDEERSTRLRIFARDGIPV
jgi:Putative restriction endonuclease